MNTISSHELRIHDIFNLVALSILCTVDIVYLTVTTDWALIGSESLGSNHQHLSSFLLVGFTLYLLVDLVWVVLVPRCVASNPLSIIIHHLACLLMTIIPWTEAQFSWHLAVNLLVEINTLMLILRRNVSLGSFAYKISNGLFYVSWVVLRLVMFPASVIFFYFEYVRYSITSGSYWNMMLVAVIGEAFITAMSFKWTMDMLAKLLSSSPSHKQS